MSDLNEEEYWFGEKIDDDFRPQISLMSYEGTDHLGFWEKF